MKLVIILNMIICLLRVFVYRSVFLCIKFVMLHNIAFGLWRSEIVSYLIESTEESLNFEVSLGNTQKVFFFSIRISTGLGKRFSYTHCWCHCSKKEVSLLWPGCDKTDVAVLINTVGKFRITFCAAQMRLGPAGFIWLVSKPNTYSIKRQIT